MYIRLVQLREHPSIFRDGQPGWPPQWTKIEGLGDKLTGEIGTLSSVTLSRLDPPTACYLLIDIGATSYMGTILSDDPEFCRKLCNFLNGHIGKSVKEIGDLDLA
jgi:hypothetical protein